MKLYDLAKLCKRVRDAQRAYFAARKQEQKGKRAGAAQLLKQCRREEFQLDNLLYESWPTRHDLEPDLVELLEFANTCRNAQKDWASKGTDKTRWAAMDAERRLDRRIATIIEKHETTSSLFDQKAEVSE